MKYPSTEFLLYEYTFIYGALSSLSNALQKLGTVERFQGWPLIVRWPRSLPNVSCCPTAETLEKEYLGRDYTTCEMFTDSNFITIGGKLFEGISLEGKGSVRRTERARERGGEWERGERETEGREREGEWERWICLIYPTYFHILVYTFIYTQVPLYIFI